jgi:hypothetical protein
MHLRKYAAKTALPGIEHGYSRAPSPVWRNSTTARVRFQAMTHKEARQLYEEARRFENATRPRNCQDGALSSAGLKLLYSLLFDFLNYATGQLDPAVGTLASKAGLSRRSAFRGLAQLKAAGVVYGYMAVDLLEARTGLDAVRRFSLASLFGGGLYSLALTEPLTRLGRSGHDP